MQGTITSLSAYAFNGLAYDGQYLWGTDQNNNLIVQFDTSGNVIRSFAARIASCFETPFRLEGEDVEVGTSVGIALRTGPGGSVEELLREADAAMYRQKERGRS